MSYTSYVPARINESKCSEETKKCPVKVIPTKKTEWSETQISQYVNMIRNSRKSHKIYSQNVNQYGGASGAQGGYRIPPRNKF